MIEINLVPDVKQELLRAQRVRTVVISLSVLTGLSAAGIVILLCIWVFGIQTALGSIYDGRIKDQNAKIATVDDLARTLTIQNQLKVLPTVHESKRIHSRIFDVLSTINPPEPNSVAISKLVVDSTEKTISIEGQSPGGYAALEVFKKTIAATILQYSNGGEEANIPLAMNISDGDRSYGEDADGTQVLRFSLVFGYADELSSPYLQGAKIIAPSKTNVTDSYIGVPNSLFSEKASDTKGSN